jgi:hypothetical protein
VIAFSFPLLAQDTPVSANASVGTHASGAPAAAKPLPKRPETYGTTSISYVRTDATELDAISSNNTYHCIQNCQLRYLTNVAGFGLMGPVHLPAGAYVTYMELDYYDNSATGQVIASFGVCNYTGETCAFQAGSCGGTATVCSDVAATPGFTSSTADLAPDGITIDNFNNRYIIAAGNTTNDGSTAISQVIIGYNLQVSPAPGSATFPDVPTSDFGFQYIEALVSSGITGGCGGGLYCPDAPVTRRQMAIFIAKALGLQWN